MRDTRRDIMREGVVPGTDANLVMGLNPGEFRQR
jgi:hypothetical protein